MGPNRSNRLLLIRPQIATAQGDAVPVEKTPGFGWRLCDHLPYDRETARRRMRCLLLRAATSATMVTIFVDGRTQGRNDHAPARPPPPICPASFSSRRTSASGRPRHPGDCSRTRGGPKPFRAGQKRRDRGPGRFVLRREARPHAWQGAQRNRPKPPRRRGPPYARAVTKNRRGQAAVCSDNRSFFAADALHIGILCMIGGKLLQEAPLEEPPALRRKPRSFEAPDSRNH